jgi:uncharacterized membrane protein
MRIRSLVFLLLCVSGISAVTAAQRYTITDLGSLAPTGINNWAQVVGNHNGHAFVWTKWGGMKDLGLLTGGTFSSAMAINDLGAVVGTADGVGTIISSTPSPQHHQCDDLTQPFIWTQRYGMQGLGSVVGEGEDIDDPHICELPFYGTDINASGQVIGYTTVYGSFYQFGFLWTSGADMSLFGGSWPPTFVNGISSAGEIVGQNSDVSTIGTGHATTWKSGVATDLGTLGGAADFYASSANGVNDLGVVVGWSTIGPVVPFMATTSPVRAILWRPTGELRDLGTLPGDASSAALRVNFFGRVIGSSGKTLYSWDEDPSSPFEVVGRPFVWSQRSGMRDLNTFIPSTSGWKLNTAADINMWGQIVGEGTLNGKPHGYLLTPTNPFHLE